MKLRDFLHQFKVSQVDLAGILGVTSGCVSALARGENMPSLELAMDIEKATGRYVSVYDWGCVTTVPLAYDPETAFEPLDYGHQRTVGVSDVLDELDELDELDRRYGGKDAKKNDLPCTTRSRARDEARAKSRWAVAIAAIAKETPNEG